MEKEIEFARSLQELLTKAGQQNNLLTKEQIKEAIAYMELTEEKLALVYDYLKQNKIGVDESVNPEEYLTENDIRYLELYLERLDELKEEYSLTQEEKDDLLLKTVSGEKEAREKLILVYLPEVAELSKLYAGQGVLVEDLIGEGNVALTLGPDRLSSAKTAREAEGMLIRLIMDAMEDFIKESNRAQEEDKRIVDKINILSDKARQLSEEAGRKITVREFASETGYTEEEILDAFEVSGRNIGYLEERYGYYHGYDKQQ